VIRTVVQGDKNKGGEDKEDEAFDVQTGHGSKIRGAIYGRTADKSPFSTEAQQLALQQVSIE